MPVGGKGEQGEHMVVGGTGGREGVGGKYSRKRELELFSEKKKKEIK